MTDVLQFNDKYSDLSVIIDENDRVAYAYLLNNSDVIGDVWLFNKCDAPEVPEWDDLSNMPFANPKSFTSDEKIEKINYETDLDVTWNWNDEIFNDVKIFLNDQLFAVLAFGSKPGWSKLAVKNGPLAKVLTDYGS